MFKKNQYIQSLLIFCLLVSAQLFSQTKWPKVITTANKVKINLYQPTPESLKNNHLLSRAAISIQLKPGDDLLFGAYWSDAIVSTDRNTKMVVLESIKITRVKFADVTDTTKINQLKKLLETEIPKLNISASLESITTTIEQENLPTNEGFQNKAPKIIYTNLNSSLVLIDGDPKLEMDQQLKLKKVVNTPFLIIQDNASTLFYLYAGAFWYSSKSITEGWNASNNLPKAISEIDQNIKSKQSDDEKNALIEMKKTAQAPQIVISTVLAELIQSDGEANMKPIEETELLYVSNSEDDIFMYIKSQDYFTLLSGRWYKSKSLKGPWDYVDANDLPPDFAKIPEGSEKDVVLSSVPGTNAAKEAVMDAQIPQTAKVDRATATCSVSYDGEAVFEPIEGTNLAIAKNTKSTVLKTSDNYFCVDNGIWFVSQSANGPWKVSDQRPADIDKIPASSPAYNVKYVYVYESTPSVVYVGYTPGYMGCYVYGPTVVYGTGFYYSPWYGPHYYPMPMTYGYGMAYNPYYGWSMSVHMSVGFFHYGGYYPPHYGYWGPPMYHPPYHPPYHGGYYGHHPVHYGNTNININHNTNIYRGNKGVNTKDIKRNPGNKPSTQPANGAGGVRPSQQPANMDGNRADGNRGAGASQQPARDGNIQTDRNGNVYKQDKSGDWQQRSNNDWNKTERQSPSKGQMDRQQQNNNRSQTRESNYNNQGNRGGGNMGGNRGGGGGGRGGRR
jgi:hypothetical protein